MRIRSTFTAGATLGAVAVLTAGCLSERWRWRGRQRQHQQHHRGHVRLRRRAGRSRLQGRGRGLGGGERRRRRVRPDRQLQPADQHPGRRATTRPTSRCSRSPASCGDLAERGPARRPLRRRRPRTTSTRIIQGVAGDRRGRRHPVRGADEHQRQEHRLLPEGGLRGAGTRRPRPSTTSSRSPTRSRRRGTTPVVLRHRVRGGDRLAGHRLGREPDADQLRRRRLQPVGQPRDPVQRRRRSRRRWTRWRSCCSPTAGPTAAGSRSPAATSSPPATRCSTSRRAATCTGRATSWRTRAASRTRSSPTSTTGSASSRCRA